MKRKPKLLASKTLEKLLDLDIDILSIGAGKNQEEVLENIAQATWNFLGGSFCVVQPYEQSSDRFLLNQFTAGGDPKAKAFTWKEPRKGGSARTTLMSSDGILPIEDYDRLEYKEKYPFLEGSVGAFRDILPVKASIGIRLNAGTEIVGVIFVNYADVQKFTTSDIELAKEFAVRAAFAIRNARLYDKSLKINKLLVTANKLTSLIGETEEIIHTALEDAVHIIGMHRGGIVLHEGTGGRLVASYPRRDGPQVLFRDSKLQRKARNVKEPIEIYDVSSDSELDDEERRNFIERGIKSSLITPLIAQDKVIGTIGLDELENHRHFSDNEKEVTMLIANATATAIDNARLYTSVIEVSGRLLQRALDPSVNRKEFYRYVIEETLTLMNFDAGWLLEKEGERVRIVMTDSAHQDDIGRHFHMDESISGKSVQRKELILINNLDDIKDKELRSLYRPPSGTITMRSELVVPLMIGDEVIGAFNIESNKINAFRKRDEEILKLLSSQIANAVELARLRETTRLISNLELVLSQKTEMGEVLSAILLGALQLVHQSTTGYGQILLLEGDKLITSYTTNPRKENGDPPDDLDKEYEIENSNSGLAIIEKKPIIVSQIDEPEYYVVTLSESEYGRQGVAEKKFLPRVLYQRALEIDKEKIQAEFAVPIIVSGKSTGVVNIETSDKDGFKEKERIEVEKDVRQKSEEIYNAFKQSNQSDLDRLLDSILIKANTKFGQILRLAEESKNEELVIESTTGGEPLHTRVKVNASISGRCIVKQTSIYIPDVKNEPEYQRYLGEEMKSELVIPLIFEDEIIGVLNLESPLRSFYTISHVIDLETFAAQAVVAIDRAKKYTTRTFTELGVQASYIIHSLNSPLGAMSQNIGIYKNKPSYREHPNPEIEKLIQRLERDLADTRRIIEELRPKVKIELAPTAIMEMLSIALEKAELPGNISVEISEAENNIKVKANNKLYGVFINLFTNAYKSMPNGGRLDVAIDILDQEWVLVKVSDTGLGIEKHRLDFIFERGESTTNDSYTSTHGEGLWWTREQVESFGGNIWVESTIGEGTSFTVKLRRNY